MFSISDPKLKLVGKDILEGRSDQALQTLNSLLDTDQKSIAKKIDYQLLKIQAMLSLGNFHEVIDYFDSNWEDIAKQGTELQRMDLLVLKARYVHDSLGSPEENRFLIEEFENIFQNSDQKQSFEYLQRYALFLNYKRYLLMYHVTDTSEKRKLSDDALKLCEEIGYDYGYVFSIIKLSGYFETEMEREEYTKIYEKAFSLSEKNKNFWHIGLLHKAQCGFHNVTDELERANKSVNESYEIFKKIDSKHDLADTHNNYAIFHSVQGELDKAMKHLELSYEIARETGYRGREILCLHNLGTAHVMKMEHSKAIPYFEEGLALTQDSEKSRMPCVFLRGLGGIYAYLGELNRSFKFLNLALEDAKERNHTNDIATLSTTLMKAYINKGDLNKALEFTFVLDLFEKDSNWFLLSESLRYHGDILQMLGDSDEAMSSYNRSLEISKRLENNNRLAEVYYSLMSLHLENKDMKNATKNANLLKTVAEISEEKVVTSRSLLANALVLKESPGKDNSLNSQRMLEEVISIEDLEFDLLVTAILNLCELLLLELKISEDPESLSHLSDLTEELHLKSIQQNVFPLIAQTVWLQSQIALLDLDVAKARILMTKAQSIAEEKEIEKLAVKISNVHDILLEQLDLWESMLMELPAIAERLELTHIETILEEMIKGKGIVLEESEKVEETPVLLLITSDNGSILYSEQFDTSLDSQMINQILPNIMRSSQEKVAETSIDRSMFQEYNYLLKRLENVSFCYMFIGKSYEGIRKLEQFTKLVCESSQIWSKLTASSLEDSTFDSSVRLLLNQFIDNIFQ